MRSEIDHNPFQQLEITIMTIVGFRIKSIENKTHDQLLQSGEYALIVSAPLHQFLMCSLVDQAASA